MVDEGNAKANAVLSQVDEEANTPPLALKSAANTIKRENVSMMRATRGREERQEVGHAKKDMTDKEVGRWHVPREEEEKKNERTTRAHRRRTQLGNDEYSEVSMSSARE